MELEQQVEQVSVEQTQAVLAITGCVVVQCPQQEPEHNADLVDCLSTRLYHTLAHWDVCVLCSVARHPPPAQHVQRYNQKPHSENLVYSLI